MKQDFINNNLQREPITAATAIGLGITAAAQGGQIYAAGKMNRKTREWNEKMYGIQRGDALRDWEAQNRYNSPAEQIRRLKEAGLNPALMYGEGGSPGGVTAAARGSAPGSWNPQMPNMGMGIEGLMAMSQIKLNEAQAQKLKVEATKIGTIDTEKTQQEVNTLLQGIENAKAQEVLTRVQGEIAEIERQIKDHTFNDVIDIVYRERNKLEEEVKMLKRENAIGDATKQTKINTIKAELGYILTKTAAEKQGIEVNKAQITKIFQDIAQGWTNLEYQGNQSASNVRTQQHQRWVNDIQESTKLTTDQIADIIKAIGLAKLLEGGRVPIKGFGGGYK